MTKQMRELLEKIKAKRSEAKGFLASGETEKAQGCMNEITDLQKQYDIAKSIFEAEKEKVPDEEPEDTKKKTSGFNIIAKMLRKQPLNETEKAMVTDGASGENLLIPEDVRLHITELRKQYKSAKSLVSIFPTNSIEGGFNFEKGSPAGLVSFDDGDDIDNTGNPEFVRKPFKIKLFGKIIPISNLLKGLEKAGLMAYINKWFVKNAIISENKDIFGALKADKTAKAVKGWAALKTAINKDLDPDALIGAVIVTNQTGFDALDGELDGMGRPILKENPADPTDKRFQGLPIHVFSDAQLPNVSGKAPMFFGALDAGIYFIELMGLQFGASEHFLFNKNQTALRVIEGYDVIGADKDAYIYATFEPTPQTTP